MAFVWDYTDPPEFYQEIVQLGMRGLSFKECGDFYGLDPLEWDEFCEDHPLTKIRHDCGKAKGIALAGQELLNQIRQGKVQAISFYLKTVGNFAEKSTNQFEESLKVMHIPPPPVPTDPIEASKTYQQFMKDS